MTPDYLIPKVTGASGDAQVQNAINVGLTGEPIRWWVIMAALLVGLMWFAKRYDGDGKFANVRLSAYNIFTISLASIIGITLFKHLFTTFPVPGLSTVVLAV